jgi:hypothetical protein
MRDFLSGATAALCLVVALYFLRFWRQTRDRLFVYFSLAFAVLALNWVGLAYVPPQDEARTLIYAMRLVAFALILIAIVDKNRSNK